MRWKKIVAAWAALAVAWSVALAVPASANEAGYGEGCTPGFWKNHLAWKSYDDNPNDTADDFGPSTDLEDSLRVDVPSSYSTTGVNFESATALDALRFQGGSTLNGAAQILLRHSVAAYLNADAGLQYPLRRFTPGINGEPPLRDQIQSALDSYNRDQILRLARKLDAYNNAYCPLS